MLSTLGLFGYDSGRLMPESQKPPRHVKAESHGEDLTFRNAHHQAIPM